MKSVINGKRYDTETALLIGKESANCSRSDFSYWEAELYRTKRSGAYFLAGYGGPMTQFGQSVDGGRTSGSKIIPMSEDEAYQWVERYLSSEKLEEHFHHKIEDA